MTGATGADGRRACFFGGAGGGGGDNEKWFQIQDLIVEEIRKEMIFLGETVLQVKFKYRTRMHRLMIYTDMGTQRIVSVRMLPVNCSLLL